MSEQMHVIKEVTIATDHRWVQNWACRQPDNIHNILYSLYCVSYN